VQETSLLLGNLVDVLDEIDDAKGELLNLTSANFSMDSQTGLLSIPYFCILEWGCMHIHFQTNRQDYAVSCYFALRKGGKQTVHRLGCRCRHALTAEGTPGNEEDFV
jgi:hypothetical protein